MKTLVHENPSGLLWWRSEGFLHLRPHGDYEAQAEDVEDMGRAILAFLSKDGTAALRRVPLLIDRTHTYVPSFQAWRSFQKQASLLFLGIAYYAPTSGSFQASEYERDFFLRDRLPIAIYASLEDAERWLVGLGEQ